MARALPHPPTWYSGCLLQCWILSAPLSPSVTETDMRKPSRLSDRQKDMLFQPVDVVGGKSAGWNRVFFTAERGELGREAWFRHVLVTATRKPTSHIYSKYKQEYHLFYYPISNKVAVQFCVFPKAQVCTNREIKIQASSPFPCKSNLVTVQH